jgi:hypothetical protein
MVGFVFTIFAFQSRVWPFSDAKSGQVQPSGFGAAATVLDEIDFWCASNALSGPDPVFVMNPEVKPWANIPGRSGAETTACPKVSARVF